MSILAAWILAKKPLKAWLSVLAVVLQLGSYQTNIACTYVMLACTFGDCRKGQISRNLMWGIWLGSTKFWDMANPYARYGEFWAYPDLLRMAYNGVLRDIEVNLTYAEDDVSAAMNGRDDVKNMPLFPAEGSI